MSINPKEAFLIGQRLRADRICFVDREKGPVRLFLHATNSLMVEMKADLIPPSANSKEDGVQTISLDTAYHPEETIDIDPEKLNQYKLVAYFIAQSVHPEMDRGKITLDFFQQNQQCKINKPSAWVRIVPKFGTGRAYEWAAIVRFCLPA